MIVVMAVFVVLCLYKVKFSHFHADYMQPGQTGAIKGIFAIIIFFSHARSYLDITSGWDELFCFPLDLLGQLMVTMFFFYSGYGIVEAYRNKENYSRTFFRGRILKTLVHFDLAVALYLILSLIVGSSYPAKYYALCWVGWLSIGNSNWFVCDMLLLYLVTLAAMLLANRAKRSLPLLCMVTTVLTGVLWVILWRCWGYNPGGPIWYNTLFCYPCGMWFALVKRRLDPVIQKRQVLFWPVLLVLFLVFAGLYLRRGNVVMHTVCACIFCVIVMLLTTKVKLDNPILRWLGKHSFSIYILQRIPMILLEYFGLTGNHLVFLLLSLAATLALSVAFDRLLELWDRRLFAVKRG